MMKDLQCHEELYKDNISSSSENDLLNERNKRLKVKCTRNERTIYTGKECLAHLG